MARKTRSDDSTVDDDPDTVAPSISDDFGEPTEQPTSYDGLVKMTRDGQTINAHPTVVEEHKKNGWKLA